MHEGMTVHEILRARLLRRAGLVEPLDIDAVRASQWSPAFEDAMRNRLVLGTLRYGDFFSPVPPIYANATSARDRLNEYLATGNLELLVDAANLCLIEFERGRLGSGEHPSPAWAPHDDGVHVSPV